MKYFLPIFSFSFVLILCQYNSNLYSLLFLMAASYIVHKYWDQPKEENR